MSLVQRAAQIFGWAFVVVAIWGFVVAGASMEADPALAPRILGLFPVNILHNLIHLGFGIWGIWAAGSFATARGYARIAGVIYLVLTVLGFIIPTTFGLVPIGGHIIWLHGLIGVALVAAGFTASPVDAVPAATAGSVGPERPAAPPPPPPPPTPTPPMGHEPPPPPPPPAPPAGDPDRTP